MAYLSKEQILFANDSRTEDVSVPEWGGVVRIKEMTASARDAFEQSLLGKDRKPSLSDARAKLAASCICDENGDLLFSQADVVSLGRKSAKALDRVVSAIQRINAMSDEELEESVKN